MKKIFTCIYLVAITATIVIGARQIPSNTSVESLLSFENVEALAWGENHNKYHCVGVGSLDCPGDNSKVLFCY